MLARLVGARTVRLLTILLSLACGAPGAERPIGVVGTSAPEPASNAAPSARGPEGRVGTGDASRLVASGSGGWAVVCEAREDTDGNGVLAFSLGAGYRTVGDEARPYFVHGVGLGEPVEDFLAADPRGRWVALARDGAAWLYDCADASWRELGSMPEEPRRESHAHPFFSFGGGALAFVTAERGLVVRDLATGAERAIPSIDGRLVLVTARRGAVSTEWVVEDTNGNGELDLSGLATRPRPPDASPCVPRDGDGLHPPPRRADRIAEHVFWWSEAGVVERAPPGRLVAAGPGYSFFDRAGGTVRVSPPGSPPPREVSVGAGLHVLAVSEDGRGWVAQDSAHPSRLVFVRDDGPPTELDVPVVPGDLRFFVEGDLLALETGEAIVDLRTGETILRPGRTLRQTAGFVVAVRDFDWTVVDAQSGAASTFPGRVRSLHGRYALVGDDYPAHVVDLATGEVRGEVQPAVWDIADDGRVLTSPVPDEGPIGPGPYTWRWPSPPPIPIHPDF